MELIQPNQLIEKNKVHEDEFPGSETAKQHTQNNQPRKKKTELRRTRNYSE